MESDEEPCTVPRDGEQPGVWSCQVGSGPFSLLLGAPLVPECPPPVYLSMRELSNAWPTDFRAMLAGFSLPPEGGMVLVDPRVIENQRGVIVDVVKAVAACMVKGKGVVGLSLPIRLFEPRSTIERMLDRWAFAPVFLPGAELCGNVERFKRVLAMAIAGLHIRPSQEKPFNPLLGDTLQAQWPDGMKAYCEHTSHHPPVSNFFVQGASFTITGHYELAGRFKGNSLLGSIVGPTTVTFASGQKVTYTYGDYRVGGMLYGTRSANWEGEMHFEDKDSEISATVKFGPEQKKSLFRSRIGKNDDFAGSLSLAGEEVSAIEGNWLKNLIIDGVEYWNVDTHKGVFHTFSAHPLPSDWRYREDLVWLWRGNRQLAETWKHRIEERQRQDRHLRSKSLHARPNLPRP